MESIRSDFIFLGYAVLKQKKHPDADVAVSALKTVDIDLLLVSEERELETNSIAILNALYSKN